jgi:tetratricopeptide (TPR) repeat protein
VHLLTPAALLGRLERHLPLPGGGPLDLPERQRTLRATLAWSHDLLAEAEQALFRRLAAFAGGCTVEAAEAVCADGALPAAEGLERLETLIDSSLVQQAIGADGESRFGMLETIREYALERLDASGEADALRRRHADYYLAVAEEAAPTGPGGTMGPLGGWIGGRGGWLDRLEREHENIRGALSWTAEYGQRAAVAGASVADFEAAEVAALGLRLGAVLWPFWLARGYLREGRAWLAVLLAAPGAAGRTRVRAKALDGAGLLAWYQGDYAAAGSLHGESLEIWRELEDEWSIPHALLGLGHAARAQGDLAGARARYEESLASWREVGDRRGIATSLRMLGHVAYLRGDVTTAGAHYEESLALLRDLSDHQELSDRLGMAACLAGLAEVLRVRRDYAAARALHEESLELRRQEEDKRGVALCLARLAGVAVGQGQLERAARLLGATEALLEACSARMDDPLERIDYDRNVAAARAKLGAEAFAAAWAAGRAMSLEQAIAYALAAPAPEPEPGTPGR